MQNLSDAVGLPCLWMCCSFLWIWHFSTVPALSFPLCNSRNRGKETQQQSCHPPLPQLLPFSGPQNLQSTDLLLLMTHNPSTVKQTIPNNKHTQWKFLSHCYQLILKVSRARVEIQIACCCQHEVNYNCQKPAPVSQGKVLVHWIQKHICSSFVLWKCYWKN